MKIEFNPDIYIHRLNSQELGYRKGIPGKAGRYFYISKKYVIFFPVLSEIIVNDHLFLDIVPPNSEDRVLTNYIYHNDKIAAKGTRDEYRLYLNSKNDPGRDFFKPDDIILIVKLYVFDDDTDDDYEDKNGATFTYKILHYPKSHRAYQKLSSLLEKSDPVNKSHAVIGVKMLSFLDELRKIRLGKLFEKSGRNTGIKSAKNSD